MGKVSAPTIIQTPAHPNNYTVGRTGGRDGQFTFHHVVGTADSAVAVFQNPNRQASSTYIVTDTPGVIYQPVNLDNTSWADGNWASNCRSVTCEHHGDWRNGYRNETVIQNSALLLAWLRDNGIVTYWHRHREVSNVTTQCCADLPVEEIWNRATAIINAANSGTPTPSTPVTDATLTWTKFDKVQKFVLNKDAKLWNFNQTAWSGFGDGVKQFNKGDMVDIYGQVVNENLKSIYYLTEYSYTNGITNGFNKSDLDVYVAPAPVTPEWITNRKNIEPIKLMVLPDQTPLYSLLDLSVIKNIAQGTWIDFVQSTTVQGKEYLISSYSGQNGLPNGILREAVGVPETPANEKPEWLKNWQDITDVTMYARCDTDLVNLEDGSTIKTIPLGTAIEVASTTEWYSHKYAITKYSTDKMEGRGIRIDDLDMKPVNTSGTTVTPAPNQPEVKTVDTNVVIAFLESLIITITKLITDFINKIKG